MNKKILLSLSAIMAVSALNAGEIAKNVNVNMEDTVRYQNLDRDSNTDDINGITNKFKINVSGDLKVLSGVKYEVEVTDVRNLDEDSANTTLNGEELTEINRANLSGMIGSDTTVIVGRQAAHLDNGRMVSNGSWNLKERTVDGVAVVNTTLPNTTLFAAHGWRLNNADVADGTNVDFTLLNAKFSPKKGISISVYDYMIEDTHDTIGGLVTLTEGIPSIGRDLTLNAEYAKQTDPTIGDASNVDGKFYDVNANLTLAGTTLTVGHTVSEDSFSAPLGENHAFLGTSDEVGLGDVESTYVGIKGEIIPKLTANASYHMFDTESTGADLGDEIDLGVNYAYNENVSVMAKTAMYNGEAANTDVSKTWVGVNIKF